MEWSTQWWSNSSMVPPIVWRWVMCDWLEASGWKGLQFAVTLPSFLFLPVFLQSAVSRSQCVKAGTEEKLVRHLLHSFSLGDSSFITIFLSTYRSFTSTGRVLDILSDRLERFLLFIFISDDTIIFVAFVLKREYGFQVGFKKRKDKLLVW